MKARQVHILRLQPETDARAPLVEVYNLRGVEDGPAPRTLAVVRYGDDLEGEEIHALLEGVEAALNDGPEASTITPMALDASLAFEVYEIDEEAPEEGDPTTALVRARGDYLRLRNLEAARAAGWTARIAGAANEPPEPFTVGDFAARWLEGWEAADQRVEHGVLEGQLERWKAAAFEVCARRSWGAFVASLSTAPGFMSQPPWPELPEAEQSGWRRHVRGWLDMHEDSAISAKYTVPFKAARAIAATFRSFNLEV